MQGHDFNPSRPEIKVLVAFFVFFNMICVKKLPPKTALWTIQKGYQEKITEDLSLTE